LVLLNRVLDIVDNLLDTVGDQVFDLLDLGGHVVASLLENVLNFHGEALNKVSSFISNVSGVA